MDADSWQSIALILSVYLCAECSLYAGASSEESSANDPAGTGLGLSLRTLSSASLALTFAGAASAFFYALISRRTLPAGVPALLLVLFWLAVLMLALFLPCFLGKVRSEQLQGKLKPARMLCYVFTPLASLLALPARAFVLRANGGRDLDEVTEEDVMELVDTAEDDVIDREQKEMISNIFELDDAQCGDMAVHRTEVTAVPLSAAAEEVVELAVSTGYSRLPVYDGTLDRILGVYHVKDLLPYLQDPSLTPDLQSLIRPVLFVSESYKATALLRDFRQKKAHLAVVVDEYGGTSGIVTLEDILESIVGDIEDEYDEEEKLISPQEDGSVLCNGFAEILDVFEALGVTPPEDADEEYDTIGGLVTDLLGYIPAKNEHPQCSFGGLLLTVADADERRVTAVSVAAAAK